MPEEEIFRTNERLERNGTWGKITGISPGPAISPSKPASVVSSRPASPPALPISGSVQNAPPSIQCSCQASTISQATFGSATSNDYQATFFAAYPELKGQVVVHHAVEQQTLIRFPGVVTELEIHSLENLRGIPNEINNSVHLSNIRREWNQFYRQNPSPSKQQFLQKASEIDAKYGSHFRPKM
jgi:hypothetical protein